MHRKNSPVRAPQHGDVLSPWRSEKKRYMATLLIYTTVVLPASISHAVSLATWFHQTTVKHVAKDLEGFMFDLGSRDGRADILRSPFYGASVSCRTTSWYDNDHIIIVIQWPSYSCVPCIEHGSSTRALRRLHFPQSSESEGLHAQLSLCPLRKYPRLYSMAVTSS